MAAQRNSFRNPETYLRKRKKIGIGWASNLIAYLPVLKKGFEHTLFSEYFETSTQNSLIEDEFGGKNVTSHLNSEPNHL